MKRLSTRLTSRLAARFALAALVGFHGYLLWQRLSDGSLLEPTVLGRWLGSAVLAVALCALHRRCGTVWRGRPAAVIWTLVLLLHAVGGAPAGQMMAAPAPWLALPLAALAAGVLVAAFTTVRNPVATRRPIVELPNGSIGRVRRRPGAPRAPPAHAYSLS